ERSLARSRELRKRSVAEPGEERASPVEILRSHHDVQVSELAEREVAVGGDGERGPFDRHGEDSVRREELEELDEPLGEHDVAQRVAVVALADGVGDVARNVAALCSETAREEGSRSMATGSVRAPGPVAIPERAER